MLRNYIIGTGLLISTSLAWAGDAGRVVFVTGQAQLANRAAVLDATVNEGDEIVTGADGYVYVKTVDNGFLILRPNSKARVTAYQIDKKNPANTRVKLELEKGVARAISGEGVKQARQNFRFNTPVAAIGVRGTDFIVYTDNLTSRVSVVSGGVVMSPFTAACSADGAGPCEGNASRELFAGQAGMLLQVQRGQTAPQLLNNPTLAPDQTEKPRPDEPVGKVSQGSAISPAVVNLDPQRSELSLNAVRPAAPSNPTNPPSTPDTTPTPPPVITPPPVVGIDPTPPVPKPQEIFWGRWQTVANAAVMPDSMKGKNLETTFVGNYAVGRLKDSKLVMPTEGTVAFTLQNSEAYVQKNGGVEKMATVDSGKLDIN
ncbi:MAG TPA: FecR family protein, partial [Pseudoduganella sp.]